MRAFGTNINKFTQTDTMISRIYGLPKIHKIGCPLQPVVSSINSPTYFLSQQYAQILKYLIIRLESHIKSSYELEEKLKNTSISDDHILVSIDATSLHTNVSKKIVIESIRKRYHQIYKIYKIPLNEIINGINLIMDNTYFDFQK